MISSHVGQTGARDAARVVTGIYIDRLGLEKDLPRRSLIYPGYIIQQKELQNPLHLRGEIPLQISSRKPTNSHGEHLHLVFAGPSPGILILYCTANSPPRPWVQLGA